MKLDKFIKDTCCNLVRNECIGVWHKSRFNDTDKCWVLDKEEPTPCHFFEKIVLPVAIKRGNHEELCHKYANINLAFKMPEIKKPKKCRICGTIVDTMRRFCNKCNAEKVKQRRIDAKKK